MLSLLQRLAKYEEAWPTLFKNSLTRPIAIRRRFSAPRIQEEVSWIATDATPSIIGVVDWRARNYIRADAEETMKDYVEEAGLQSVISDKELMELVLGSVAGFAAHPGAVLFIGVDNVGAPAWAIRGKSRGKFARGLLSTFLLWRLYHGIEVIIFYLRTNHNVTADEIIRLEDKDLIDWGNYKGLRRIEIPGLWVDFKKFIPHLDWERPREQAEPLELTEEIITFCAGMWRNGIHRASRRRGSWKERAFLPTRQNTVLRR